MPASDKVFTYVPRCDVWNCRLAAEYKIAATWTDGVLTELKPYALACPDHVRQLFFEARRRHQQCKLGPDEALGPLRIYRLSPGRRDSQLEPAVDIEQRLGLSPETQV